MQSVSPLPPRSNAKARAALARLSMRRAPVEAPLANDGAELRSEVSQLQAQVEELQRCAHSVLARCATHAHTLKLVSALRQLEGAQEAAARACEERLATLHAEAAQLREQVARLEHSGARGAVLDAAGSEPVTLKRGELAALQRDMQARVLSWIC